MKKQQRIYNYTDFEKSKLGPLMGFYRKQCNMIYDDVRNENGPSIGTFRKIEKGYITKSDYIYDDCMELFSKKFKRKDNFEQWLVHYLPRLENALEFHDLTNLKILEQEFEQELSEYKEYCIYGEYYQVIHNLFQYNLRNQYLNMKEFERMYSLLKFKFLEIPLKIYLLELVYITANNVLCDFDKLMEISKLMVGLEENPIIMYLLANNEKCNSNFQTALEIYQRLEEYWRNRNNYYCMIKNELGIFTIYKNTDKSKAEDYAIKLKKIKNEQFSCLVNRIINYNVGMFYYYNNNLIEANELFSENILNYKNKKEWLYIGAISTMRGTDLPDEILAVDLSDEPTKEYIEYFRLKKKGVSNNTLAYYIMDTLIPQKLKYYKSKEPYWSIFEKELLELSKKSRSLSKFYFKYLEKMEYFLKKAEY